MGLWRRPDCSLLFIPRRLFRELSTQSGPTPSSGEAGEHAILSSAGPTTTRRYLVHASITYSTYVCRIARNDKTNKVRRWRAFAQPHLTAPLTTTSYMVRQRPGGKTSPVRFATFDPWDTNISAVGTTVRAGSSGTKPQAVDVNATRYTHTNASRIRHHRATRPSLTSACGKNSLRSVRLDHTRGSHLSRSLGSHATCRSVNVNVVTWCGWS